MRHSNCILLAGILTGTMLAAGRALPAVEQVPLAARPFPRDAIRLLDGPFADAQRRNGEVLLQLDPDRLLHMFRVTAGLPSHAEPYGGWEAPEIEVRGHTLGHYLTACALTYAATADPRFQERTQQIVTGLSECQQALAQQATHPGYLAAFPESFFDRVETLQPVWVPWYTLHKILAGLLDTYEYCDNQQALDVAVQVAGWIAFRVDRLSHAQQQAMLDTEFGGMNEVLAHLYSFTSDPDHLRLARVFDHERLFDPLAQGDDRLDGLHANTQVPKVIGAAREYEVTGESRYLDIARCFWDRVALHRSYVTGGHSDHEHFFPPTEFAKHLSPETTETCNTYNMLKLTQHLFAIEPTAAAMDFHERALYNHILAAQDPRRGMFVYFLPLKPGHFKSYSTLDNSFWCCFGTGLENPARYGDAIFAHGDDALYVNLFIAAEVRWPELGLVLRQETRFPEEDTTRLQFDLTSPRELALRIRHPGWATAGITVTVNGALQPLSSTPGSYVTVRRTWQRGDRVEVRLPMAVRTESLPHADHWLAFLYGPIVLAGDLGTEGLETLDLYTHNQVELTATPTPEVPILVGDSSQVLSHVQPVDGQPLTFQTAGLGRPADVVLQPLYRVHHRRYAVYWECRSAEHWQEIAAAREAAAAARRELEARTVDVVVIGNAESEQEHRQQGERTTWGPFSDRAWRHADDGGWFSYDMQVLPDKPMTLLCTYWGSDSGNRHFDLLVDGTQIATQRLDRDKPDEFFDVQYPIPAALTRGRTTITVRFQAHPGHMAGGVFELRIVR